MINYGQLVDRSILKQKISYETINIEQIWEKCQSPPKIQLKNTASTTSSEPRKETEFVNRSI